MQNWELMIPTTEIRSSAPCLNLLPRKKLKKLKEEDISLNAGVDYYTR